LQQIEDPAAMRFGQHLEHGHEPNISGEAYNQQVIFRSGPSGGVAGRP
jgi:hypothetical protein